MKVKINLSLPDAKNHMLESDQKIEISLPIKAWIASKFGDSFRMSQDGNGAYLGPNQMFGGPKGGDLILYDNPKTREYYAVMTSMTQDWHQRSGKVQFICFRDEIVNRIVIDLRENPQPYEDIIKHMSPMLGLDGAVRLCTVIASDKVREYIHTF
jgi:hypothetical protein